MALPVTITGISTVVAPVGPFQAATGLAVTGTAAFSGTAFGNIASTEFVGQTWTTDAAATPVIRVGFLFGVGGGVPTGGIVAKIYAVDGSNLPTGPVLATSDTLTLIASQLGTSQFSYFTFSTPFVPSASTQYAVVLSRTIAVDAANYYLTYISGGSSTYASGVRLAWSGSAWAAQTNDLSMAVGGGSAYYFFGRDGTTATTLQAFKSTAPDTSWASIKTQTGFTTAILNLSAYQVGNAISLIVNDGTASTALATKYISFDTIADTFQAGGIETVLAATAVTGQTAGVGANATVVVRSNGEVVAFYQGLQTKTSGTFRARVYYKRRTGPGTWSAETQVDSNIAADNNWPTATLGAADRVHFHWNNQTGTAYRTLSAANVLNTAGTSATMGTPGDSCSYDRSGTTKIVVTNNGTGQSVMRFDSSDNPTPSFSTVASAVNATLPHRIGADTGTDDVTIVYRNSADSDLWAIKSTDDGATWGTAVSFFVGTVVSADQNASRSASGSMYQRGSNVVVGYIVNDNGTLKYNEYLIRTVVIQNIGTASGVGGSNVVGATIGGGLADADGVGGSSVVGTGIVSDAVAAAGVGGSSVVGERIVGVTATTAGVGGSSVVGQAVVPNYVSGNAAAAGVGGSSVVGEVVIATTDATATAAGAGATAVTGTAIKSATATAAGISTTTAATGSSFAASTATATGTGATAITGRAVTERTVTAGGIGASNIVNRSFYATIGLSSGIGAGGAASAYIFGVAVTAAGVGASAVIGGQVGVNVGTASGLGTATFVGASSATTTATAAGVGSTAVAGTSVKPTVAGAAGLAAGTATGRSFAAGTFAVAGISTATATGTAILARTVTAAGVGAATAAGGQVGVNAFSAAGIGTANAVGRSTAAVIGAATGVGAAPWAGTALKAVGVTATGAGAAAATGRATVAGVATAVGTGASAFIAPATLAAVSLVAPLPVFVNPAIFFVSPLRLGDRVLDYGLVTLDVEADKIYICNGFPNTYLEATSTFAIGSKSFGQGLVFGAPAAGVPKGRKITSVAVSDGLATEIGTPQCWAVVDSVNYRLLATGPANGFRTVGVNWSWTLEQVPIHMDG